MMKRMEFVWLGLFNELAEFVKENGVKANAIGLRMYMSH